MQGNYDFQPVPFYLPNGSSSSNGIYLPAIPSSFQTQQKFGEGAECYVKLNNKTLYWYSGRSGDASGYQFNMSNYIYYWV